MGFVIIIGNKLGIRYATPYAKTVSKNSPKCTPCKGNDKTLVKLITTHLSGN